MTDNLEDTSKKKKLHFAISGPSGQCGKSTLVRILLEKYRSEGKEVLLIDADEENPNVAIAYDKEARGKWPDKSSKSSLDFLSKSLYQPSNDLANELTEQIVFSTDPKYAHLSQKFTELVEASQSDIVVSMPAGTGVETWLDEFGIDTEMTSPDRVFDLVCWWVSGGSQLSQSKLVDFSIKYPNIKVCCVLNKGAVLDVPNWDRFILGQELSIAAKEDRIKLAMIDAYNSKYILEAVANGHPFYEILDKGIPQTNGEQRPISRLTRGGLKGWLQKAWDSINKTGLL